MIYRQISHRLRWHRGPGLGECVSERPRDARSGAYSDEAAPTLITIEASDPVDVAQLLASGAIAPWTDAPRAAPKTIKTESPEPIDADADHG